MTAEILDYRFTTKWQLEETLHDDMSFKKNLEPDYPLIVSSMSMNKLDSLESTLKSYNAKRHRHLPVITLDSFPGGYARRIGEYLGLSGYSMSLNANCSSALYALHTGSIISQAEKKPVVVVCADNVNSDFDHWRFKILGALDIETGRPFDKSSKGFKMGTGIVAFLIKHPSVKSPMPPIATATNFKFYSTNTFTHPGTSDDIINNIQGINYKDIDFWNAHATGTPVGDIVEYEVFAKNITKDVPIVSFKGHIGHCMCASGAMEIALALDCKLNNKLIPNIIIGEKIINDDRIITESTSFPYKKMLKASFAFGGKTSLAEISLY